MVFVGIVDCGFSNIRSVSNALEFLGVSYRRVMQPSDLNGCSHLILPGDGTFSAGMNGLIQTGLADALRLAVAQGRYLLGICLGMQLLATEGTEFESMTGLGLIPGRIVRLTPTDPRLPVPQVGWNQVTFTRSSCITHGLGEEDIYYFMHSYSYENPHAPYVVATFDYGGEAVAIIEAANVFGFQFHPEKSQKAGLRILRRFIELA